VRCHRSAVLSSAAKELEFSVHSMSVSQVGYATRSKSAVNSVRRLARDEAWASVQGGGDTTHEDEWNVISLLRRACSRVEVDNGA
jgi:bloom syndrome protein